MSRHYEDAAGPYEVIGDDDPATRDVAPIFTEETWLLFDAEDDEEASHEATIDRHIDGDRYVVGWSHVDVGVVTEVVFDKLEDAHYWLEDGGYIDFTA